MIRAALPLVLVGTLAAACSDRDKPEVKREPERPRRVIEPPPHGVRALPPHAIRADGVGPYQLGALAADLLDQLPSGPRIRQFTIPGIVHRDMLRGEDDAILIGTEPQGRAMFVAVVRKDLARTESGIQVGSTRAELDKALGPPVEDPDRLRDPRIVIPSKLDNAHVVFDGDRIAAIVLTPPVERAKDGAAAPKDACTRPAGDPTKGLFGACLTSAGELLRATNDEIAVLGKDGEKTVGIPARVPDLVFAGSLRHHGDGRDDIVAIVETKGSDTRTWTLITYRMVDNKLLRVAEPAVLYQLTAAHARWIGSELDDLDLYLELTGKADTIEASGLLATRAGGSIEDIVVISSATVPRRRLKAAPAEVPIDAGTSDGAASTLNEPPSR